MSNVLSFSKYPQAEDEACAWIAKIDRGLSVKERLDFQKWITADKLNLTIFMQYAKFWDITEEFQQFEINESDPQKEETQSSKVAFSRLFQYGAVAATLFISLSIFLFYSLGGIPHSSSEKIVFQKEIRSDHNIIRETLPDGSILNINARTHLKITYTENSRNISLGKGELFIDVAHDKARPLTIKAYDQYFTAVGTAFNVSIYDRNNIELLVAEGKVSYRDEKSKGDVDGNIANIGDKVTITNDTLKIQKASQKELDRRLSWRKGYLSFNGETLLQVVNSIKKYHRVEFVFESKKMKEERIITHIKPDDLDLFLSILEENFDISSSRVSNIIYLSYKQA